MIRSGGERLNAAIEVEGLRKTFRVTRKEPGLRGALLGLVRPRREDVVAVDGVSFRIQRGEMVGYIGVNGAGKSTTVKLPPVFTWVIPFGLASYWPASRLTGREAGVLPWAAPLVAGALFLAAYRFWTFGLRRYQGTGT